MASSSTNTDLQNNNKRQLIRLQQRSRDLDSRISLLGRSRCSLTGLTVRVNPIRPVLERTIQRGVETRNSSPPLNMPHPPQSSEIQPFPLPVLPRPDIPVGGRLAHFVEQREWLIDNKWVLYRSKRFQDTIQVSQALHFR